MRNGGKDRAAADGNSVSRHASYLVLGAADARQASSSKYPQQQRSLTAAAAAGTSTKKKTVNK